VSEDVSARRAEAEDARVLSPVAAAGIRGRLQRIAAAPLAEAQQLFNDALLRLVDAISTRVDGAAAQAESADRRVRELEERLLRLERRDGRVTPGTVASQPGQDGLPDYFAYETRMRASTEEISKRQRPYLELLEDHGPVLDVGAGRGELLQLLRQAGIEARGIDADADMVAYALGEGLDVRQQDLLEALGEVGEGSLGAVTAMQVVEHLPPPALIRFLELAARALRPGGLLIAETINPASPAALRHYFADLTHAQPLVPETLELLARHAGFADARLRFMNEPPPHADPRISEQLFAPLDYALIAHK
jgi:2-polyprenyl-3-methyl-5-hydroxy-6-metoxy-1,4-benzoquinol methylase